MRQYILLGILLAVAAMAGLFYFQRSEEDPYSHTASPQLLAELDRITEAQKISDPRERCLAFPDPAGYTWDRSVVEAYCELASRKSLSLVEIDEALKRGEAARLDDTFKDYMTQTYQGRHGFLIAAYRDAFAKSDGPEVAERWVKADPDSAFALTARGTAFVEKAWRSRGTKFARDTSRESFRLMDQYVTQGVADLKEAVKRSHRLNAAYGEMLSAARMTADHDLFLEAQRHALLLDPADQWVYDYWITSEVPNWGGSIADMRDVAERALRHADQNPLLKRLQVRPYCEEAEMAETCRSCNAAEQLQHSRHALDIYKKAAAIAPAACVFREGGNTAERAGDYETAIRLDSQSYRFGTGDLYPLFRNVLSLQKLGLSERALETADLAIKLQPRNPETFVHKGWVYQGMGRMAEAEKEFVSAVQIDQDNREALSELVMLYTHQLNDQAKAKAIVDRLMVENPNNPRAWLLSAVLDRGRDEKHCKVALEKYLALVDRENADSYEQRDIDRATARVKELAALEDKAAAAPSATK